jgi:hypothetical protein
VKGLRLLRSLLTALLHLVIATVGVAVFSAFCFYGLKPVLAPFVARNRLIHDAALTLSFFPFQSLVGILIGFVLAASHGKFGRSRVARWVWTVPAGFLLLLLLSWSPRSVLVETRWEHFFWSTMPDSKKEQLITTLPLLTSITYGLGSYLGCKYQRSRGKTKWGKTRGQTGRSPGSGFKK